jgi:hypothetical protein
VIDAAEIPPEKLAEVRRTIHYLQHRQFFWVPADRPGFMRRVLDNPSLRDLVRRHFDLAGYDLEHSDQEGWYGLVPRLDEVIQPRMTPTQTLVLFHLALHWQRCVDSSEIDGRGNAVTGLAPVWQELEDRLLAAKSLTIRQDKFEEMMDGEFSHKAIVSIGEFDSEAGDRPMLIRPFVRLLAGEDALTRLDRFLSGQELSARPPAMTADDASSGIPSAGEV